METRGYIPSILKQKDNTIRRAAALIVKLQDEVNIYKRRSIRDRQKWNKLIEGFCYGGSKNGNDK